MPFSSRRPLALFAALPLTLALAGCFDMDVTINGEKGVPLSDIDQSGPAPLELVLASSDKVIVSEGDTFSIVLEGSDEAREAVRFVRDGETLGITREEDLWDESDEATIRITLPAAPKEMVITGSGRMETAALATVTQISVLGSGDFSSGDATVEDLDINMAGSGSATLGALTATSLEVNLGGSGKVSASGTAERLEVTLGGSGSANFGELRADEAEITVAGSGSVDLQSDGTVEASIMGSGNVNVTGSATCKESAMGSGSLNCPGGKKTSTSDD